MGGREGYAVSSLEEAAGPDPILLLHGQPGGARDWDRVVAAIGGRALTIAVDRPGWHGVGPPRDIGGNVAAAVCALDARRVERAVVIGHSFGAAVAAWLAADYPARVSGLVLVAPAANVASLYVLDRLLAAPFVGPLLSAAALGGPGLVLGWRLSRERVARWLELDERYLADAGRWLRRPAAWRAFVCEQRALIRELPALESRLGRIAAPTAVMIGSADRVVPPWAARRLAGQIPGAELEVICRAGHLLPLRHASRIAQVALAVS